MKVFISWSGEPSRAIGTIFYEWLPTIIQGIEPWMSEHDVEKGAQWLASLSKELQENLFGLICMTPGNLNAPWLMFEAGALSKYGERSRVWTVLHELQNSDVKGPLAQFQHTRIERPEIKRLLQAMNTASGTQLIKDNLLDVSFERGWDALEEMMSTIPPVSVSSQIPERTTDDMVREMLDLLRDQSKQLKRLPRVLRGARHVEDFMLGNVYAHTPLSDIKSASEPAQYVAPPAIVDRDTIPPNQINRDLAAIHASTQIGDAVIVEGFGSGIVAEKEEDRFIIKLDNSDAILGFVYGDARIQLINK